MHSCAVIKQQIWDTVQLPPIEAWRIRGLQSFYWLSRSLGRGSGLSETSVAAESWRCQRPMLIANCNIDKSWESMLFSVNHPSTIKQFPFKIKLYQFDSWMPKIKAVRRIVLWMGSKFINGASELAFSPKSWFFKLFGRECTTEKISTGK